MLRKMFHCLAVAALLATPCLTMVGCEKGAAEKAGE